MTKMKASCEFCSIAELCLPSGISQQEMRKIEPIVEQSRVFRKKEMLFHPGEKDKTLYIVRSGSFKSYMVSKNGDEQILGFHLPGEIVGLDALENDHHQCGASALETSTVCQLTESNLNRVIQLLPNFNRNVFRIIGKSIASENQMMMLIGKKRSEERFAAFLVGLTERYRQRGYSETDLRLSMSRRDISNYLGITIETLSRIIKDLKSKDLIQISNRELKITDLKNLQRLVSDCANHPIPLSI